MTYRLILAASPSFDNYPLMKSAVDLFIQSEQERLILNGYQGKPLEIEFVYGDGQHGENAYNDQCIVYAKEFSYYRKAFKLHFGGNLVSNVAANNKAMTEYAAAGDVAGGCIVFWDGQTIDATLIHLAITAKINLRVIMF